MTKPVILTGVRSNENPTIGNYFGAILPLIEMAKHRSDEYQVNIFVPDLHSFTTPVDHNKLYEQTIYNLKVFVAAGFPLDNDNVHIYRQSYVPAHSELTWILDCFTGFGEMSRMTQFKDKSKITKSTAINSLQEAREVLGEGYWDETKDPTHEINKISNRNQVTVGLFNYPVLMAADILLYNATYVPVGDDQSQHVEYTRDIAERLNGRFGDLFTIPEPVAKQHEFFGKGQGLRIKDLADPTKKMSKSDESGKGVIFLSDDPAAAAKKVMSATTDDKASVTYDKDTQPGISNLLEILALLRGQPLADITNEFHGQERYGDFKGIVAEEIKNFLTDFQAKLDQVDEAALFAKLEASEKAMNDQANATLLRVQQAVGLRAKEL